jgi:hypothetical protein
VLPLPSVLITAPRGRELVLRVHDNGPAFPHRRGPRSSAAHLLRRLPFLPGRRHGRRTGHRRGGHRAHDGARRGDEFPGDIVFAVRLPAAPEGTPLPEEDDEPGRDRL